MYGSWHGSAFWNSWWKHLRASGLKEPSSCTLTSYLPSGIMLVWFFLLKTSEKTKEIETGRKWKWTLSRHAAEAINESKRELTVVKFIQIVEHRRPDQSVARDLSSSEGSWVVIQGAVLPVHVETYGWISCMHRDMEGCVKSSWTLHHSWLCKVECVLCHHASEPWVASLTHAMCILKPNKA